MQLAQIKWRGFALKTGLAVVLCGLIVVGAGCGSEDSAEVEVLTCSITQLSVSGDMTWLTGEPVSIRWSHNGTPKTVLIEALKDGVVIGTIAQNSANDGFHSWSAATFGQANGGGYGIRVSGTGGSNCADEISGMNITNVTGCEILLAVLPDTLRAGRDYEISWSRQFTSGLVDIELWRGLGLGDQVGIIAFGIVDTGGFNWAVDSFHEGTRSDYKIVVRDAQVDNCMAVSPSFMMIDNDVCTISVGGPAQGQVFDEGDVLAFQLVQTNGSHLINLRLYIGNIFIPGGFIADNVSTVRDTSWVVNDFDFDGGHTNFRVRAFDAEDRYCTGVSDFFTINPALNTTVAEKAHQGQ